MQKVNTNWHIEQQFSTRVLNIYLSDWEALEQDMPFDKSGLQRWQAEVWDFQNATQLLQANRLPHESNTPPGSFALINLNGTMTVESRRGNYGTRNYANMIREANANRNIKGILIRANTGNGENLAGQELLNAVCDSQKAVVVYADFLAAAGLHGMLAADEIIASGEQTLIGSIGAMVSVNKKIAQDYNDNYEDIYATQSTQKNKEWRAYLKGDTSALQASLNQATDLIQKDVQRFRNLKGDISRIMSGAIFYASEAKSLGLIDGIGTLNYALERLAANVKRRTYLSKMQN